jgi:hypothetical protein
MFFYRLGYLFPACLGFKQPKEKKQKRLFKSSAAQLRCASEGRAEY